MHETHSAQNIHRNPELQSGLSLTLHTLRRLALGRHVSAEETVSFARAVLVPVCQDCHRLYHLPYIKIGGQSRGIFHPDPRIEEAVQDAWVALLTPVTNSGLTPCGQVWTMLVRGELSEGGAISYLRATVRNFLGRHARRTAMGRLHAAIKGILGRTRGFSFVEDGNGRQFYAPMHGHHWQLAGDDLDIHAIGRKVADRLGILDLHGPWPKKLRPIILPIIHASFDLLHVRLQAGQITDLVAEALGLGGLRAQPISLDQSRNQEDGGAGLEAEVSSAWADQHALDEWVPEENDAVPEEAIALAQEWEEHWNERDGRPFAEAVESFRKRSDAPVMVAMLSCATLEEMARYCSSGVSAVQERLSTRGWAPQRLQRRVEKWTASGRSNRERFPVPRRMAEILGPLMNTRPELALSAWEVLRRKYAWVIQRVRMAA